MLKKGLCEPGLTAEARTEFRLHKGEFKVQEKGGQGRKSVGR